MSKVMTTKQWFQWVVRWVLVSVLAGWVFISFTDFLREKRLEALKQPQLITRGITRTVTRTITCDVRAYCKCKECCKRWANGSFANGEVAEGMAVASSVLARRTQLYVPGYGFAVVKDHGPNLVEVFFDKHEDAVNWGVKRNLIVEMLE